MKDSGTLPRMQVSPPRTFKRYGKRSLPAKTHSRHQAKSGGGCDAEPEQLQKTLAVLHGGGVLSRRGAVGVGAPARRGGGAGASVGRGPGGRGGPSAEGVAEGDGGAQ